MPLTSPQMAQNQPTSITATSSTTTEGKKQLRKRDFLYKHGHKLHSYDGKAPYPLCYDRSVLELEPLDTRFCQYLRNSVSFVDFEEPPSRVLDLGCGSGSWVIDAAREWPECKLVGFDLVDVQLPLKILDPSIASRIDWRHGNFITTQLPFDDDEFDHVHVHAIARAVPENKWGLVFEEICRVLRPRGTVEVIEDDIIFPTLPRWFTNALRVRPPRDRAYSHGSELFTPNSTLSETSSARSYILPPHDHALLESLHTAIYSNRFINMKPLSILPSYLTTYFTQVYLGPITKFPMPPLAPRQPLPQQQTGPLFTIKSTLHSQVDSNPPTLPTGEITTTQSFPVSPTDTNFSTDSGRPRASFESVSSTVRSATPVPSKVPLATDIASQPLPNRVNIDEDQTSTEFGFKTLPVTALLPLHTQKMTSLSDRSLAMQLYSSYQSVLACQEAMWEELKDRIRNKREELVHFGWDDDEELEELPESRKKFEKLIERYQSDMQVRLSFWRSLEDVGWDFPPREPLTKAEIVEEERLRESLMEGCKQATKEDVLQTCRAMRVIIGQKP